MPERGETTTDLSVSLSLLLCTLAVSVSSGLTSNGVTRLQPRTKMLSLAALAFLASSLAGRASANHADPSQSQYASLWTGLDQKCQGSIAALVSDTSDFAKCSGSSKLFGDLVSSAAVVSRAVIL